MRQALIVSVFVASPRDVALERKAVKRIVDELNEVGVEEGRVRLEFKSWETHAWPGFGDDPQEVINQQIGDFDIFVGIMWKRLGTRTRRAASGTVEEFENAYKKWTLNKRPSLMFYFNIKPPASLTQDELTQWRTVLKFKKRIHEHGGLYWEYRGPKDFEGRFRLHLQQETRRIAASAFGDLPLNPGVDRIRKISRKLGYWHEGATRSLLSEIEQLAASADDKAVQEAAVRAVLDFLGTGFVQDDSEATARARELRKFAFGVIRRRALKNLGSFLMNGELEAVDLFNFDFSDQSLAGAKFSRAFLAEASFRSSDLGGAAFRDAWIRNVDFSTASLLGADFSGADWFNAVNLSESQIRQIQPGSLIDPPRNIKAMLEVLKVRYGFPFDSWKEPVRESLLNAWSKYLQPGGLCDLVAERNRT